MKTGLGDILRRSRLFGPEMHEDPYPEYRELREREPVHWDEGLHAWIITSYDEVVWALTTLSSYRVTGARGRFQDPALQPLFDLLGMLMLQRDEPDHRRIRSLIQNVILRTSVDRWSNSIEQRIQSLLQPGLQTGQMDFIWDFAVPLPVLVISEIVGIPAEDRERVKQWCDDFAYVATIFYANISAEQLERGWRSTDAFRTYLNAQIEEIHRSPRDDLLSALVLGLMQGAVWGWSAPATVAFLAGGAGMMVVFIVVELRVSEPVIEVALFRNATFNGSNLVIFTGQFNKIAIVVFVALYLQNALHMSPLSAGVALLAAVIPTLFTSVPAGWLADRFGVRWLSLGGLMLNGSALLWIGFAVSSERYGLLVLPLVIWGATLPFLYAPTRRAAINAVPLEKHGQASGINLTSQLLGGVTGMAVCGTLLATTGDFRIVFLVAAGWSAAVLVMGWYSIAPEG